MDLKHENSRSLKVHLFLMLKIPYEGGVKDDMENLGLTAI